MLSQKIYKWTSCHHRMPSLFLIRLISLMQKNWWRGLQSKHHPSILRRKVVFRLISQLLNIYIEHFHVIHRIHFIMVWILYLTRHLPQIMSKINHPCTIIGVLDMNAKKLKSSDASHFHSGELHVKRLKVCILDLHQSTCWHDFTITVKDNEYESTMSNILTI